MHTTHLHTTHAQSHCTSIPIAHAHLHTPEKCLQNAPPSPPALSNTTNTTQHREWITGGIFLFWAILAWYSILWVEGRVGGRGVLHACFLGVGAFCNLMWMYFREGHQLFPDFLIRLIKKTSWRIESVNYQNWFDTSLLHIDTLVA